MPIVDIARDHVLHSRNGRLGAPGSSTVADVSRILQRAGAAGSAAGLVIHFHGGLVNAASADEIAGRLAPVYDGAGAYPLFFKWESGLLETLRNNLKDIKDDSVFQELVKKAAEWALKKLGGGVATRGSGAAVDADKLRKEFDDWFAGRTPEPPVKTGSPDTATGIKLRGTGVPDEDDLAENINAELDNDERFQEVMAGLYVASKRGAGVQTKGGNPPAADVEVLVDQRALEELFPPTTADKTKGLFTWIKVAKFVARIVIAVVKRHVQDRDHGTYTTVVEEVLRAAYIDKVGEVIWRSMKKDTGDAFGAPAECVGTATLAALVGQAGNLKRVTLVGHSTGAIYINRFLESAAASLPAMQFDILLLAPASRHEDFAGILQKHGGAVRNLRMFAMTDDNESKDQLVPIIYPRSLLYFVSGLLEGDIDVPIVGMQRFNANEKVFDEAKFPAVASVRAWLGAGSNRSIWSVDAREQGLGSGSLKHGDFDNDPATLASLGWIIKTGF